MTVATLLKKHKGYLPSKLFNRQAKRGPVWAGPEAPGPNGGITQSLLARFLTCRERFRLLVVEGLKPADTFSHRLEYGSMWHVCEEALAGSPSKFADGMIIVHHDWVGPLTAYCQQLCKRYPLQQEQIDHWYNVCKITFPLYVEHWSQHPDVTARTPLLQEQVFDVPYQLPSGRTVRLRGKWDSVDLIGKGKNASVYLCENKTKGNIDEPALKRQLASGFDLQTGLYNVALQEAIRVGKF